MRFYLTLLGAGPVTRPDKSAVSTVQRKGGREGGGERGTELSHLGGLIADIVPLFSLQPAGCTEQTNKNN